MNLKELYEKRAELQHKGDALWQKAEKDATVMSASDKEAYMETIRKEDDEIFASLSQTNEFIKKFEQYRNEERQEIAKEALRQDRGREVARSSRTDFKCLGELLQAIACASSPLIAASFPSQQREELNRKLMLYQAAASGMSTGVPSEGGYLMRTQWTTEFLDRARQASVLLPLCRRVTIGADFDSLEYPYIDETSRADGSRWGGVQVFWAAEATTVSATKPKIGKGELRLEEIMGLAYVTNRLLRDSSAIENILTNAFESEFGFLIDVSIFKGTGAGQMLGIMQSPALVSVTRNVDPLVTLLDMYEAMPSRLKSTATWFYHPHWLSQLVSLKLGDFPVWMPPGSPITGGLTATPSAMILGRPAIELEQTTGTAAPGDICFFNMGEYVVIEKENEGINFDQSMHVAFLTNEMAFRWVYRINGQPIMKSSVLRYTGSTYTSPFVVVAS
jgi:HK97 family phage major capsid protein